MPLSIAYSMNYVLAAFLISGEAVPIITAADHIQISRTLNQESCEIKYLRSCYYLQRSPRSYNCAHNYIEYTWCMQRNAQVGHDP